jgi:hypothetical protein
MFTPLIKLTLLSIAILITINFCSPNRASKITTTISETTGIKKDSIDEKLDNATKYIADSSNKAIKMAKDKIDEIK